MQHIAAGEVLAGISCVVRELVENSIDAGSGRITVEITPSLRGVAVTDDGCGVSEADGLLRMATCNSTSKLQRVEGLQALRTLGFRGQALWAVAACSEGGLCVSSRVGGQDAGVSVRFETDGTAGLAVPVAMAPGTVVHSTGLRRWDFKPSDIRACKQWLACASLCHPEIALSLTVRGKRVWSSAAGGNIVSAFARLVDRPKGSFRLSTIANAEAGMRVSVVVGLPSMVHFGNSSRIVVAVNGRCVDLPDVSAQVRDFFRSCLPLRRYPACFVHFDMSGDGVCDWNVHPMKKTMRLHTPLHGMNVPGLPDISSTLRRALELALGAKAAGNIKQALDVDLRVATGIGDDENSASTLSSLLEEKHRQRGSAFADGTEISVRQPEAEHLPRPAFFQLHPVAQTQGTYILAENETGLFLIEQHVAHERVLFEDLRSRWFESFIALAPGKEVVLPDSVARDDEQVLSLSSLGFDVCEDETGDEGETIASIKRVPRMIAGLARGELLAILISLSAAGGPGSIDEAAASLACRMAVRNGSALSQTQMESIVGGLSRCQNPHTCPHGRPIFLELGHQDLASYFQRNYIPRRNKAPRRRVSGNLER